MRMVRLFDTLFIAKPACGLKGQAYKLARLDALADQPTTSLMVSTTTTAQSANIIATTIADPTW
jgi:hypothetical protein